MKPEEIKAIAIDSATVYYNFLDQNRNNRGIQKCEVVELNYLTPQKDRIKLRLKYKLFDTESIFFVLNGNEKRYTTEEIKIEEYDIDENQLFIKPNKEYLSEFNSLNASDIVIITDLKFLVERVKSWYEKNGNNIRVPQRVSILKNKFEQINYFPEKLYQPSDQQKKAIKNIFESPFSYVWGAPGTGKTQRVLSYAILHYLQNRNKVAILAPTNNSIEQVLFGVLDMLGKADVDFEQVIRLGTPSKKFADKYPEVCEAKGLQKRINQLEKEIDQLERVIEYSSKMAQLNNFERSCKLFNALRDLISQFSEYQNKVAEEKDKLKRKEIDIKFLNDDIIQLNKQRERNLKKINSIGSKIMKHIFSKTSNAEEYEPLILNKIIAMKKEKEFLKYEYDEQEKKFKLAYNNCENKKTELNQKFQELKSIFSKKSALDNLVKNLNENNWEEIKTKIIENIAKEKDSLIIDNQLFEAREGIEIIVLQNQLKLKKAEKEQLEKLTTKERLKAVKVIACTLDGYIGRYSDEKLDVDHIFLDEAGYANLIKTVTLFNHDVPITLLGDHKQLPPVCEINNWEIEKDQIKYKNIFLWSQSSIYSEFLFSNSAKYCLDLYLNNNPFEPELTTQSTLSESFRFGSNMSNILKDFIYVEEGITSANVENNLKLNYVHAQKLENTANPRISITEVESITRIVQHLKQKGKTDFVILAPYRDQIELLKNALPDENKELKILTVHKSQGREWEIVIFSAVDTKFKKWFVHIEKPFAKPLLNTAVSRAKKQLIVVCDKNYWSEENGQMITALLEQGNEININLLEEWNP